MVPIPFIRSPQNAEGGNEGGLQRVWCSITTFVYVAQEEHESEHESMLAFLMEVWVCTGTVRSPFTRLLAAPGSQHAAGPRPQWSRP